jgi:acetoin utilization deacetylase AcuC-like enzyme
MAQRDTGFVDPGQVHRNPEAHRTLMVVDDPSFDRHVPPPEHPERSERLVAARRALERAPATLCLRRAQASAATDEELLRVHTAAYLSALGQEADAGVYLDADTYLGCHSAQAARRAAGGTLRMAAALLAGEARFGLGLVRPPGHHARPNAAMGFCLLNNVALAAAAARARGVPRVAVVDFDVHHGNGTEESFYADPTVLVISLHQYPHYPGTGALMDLGADAGAGYNVNIPLSAGADDAVYQHAFERIVCPILAEYDPALVLVSAGFDAHRLDPLGSMLLSDQAFGDMARRLRAVLDRRTAAPLAFVLEGGYDLRALEGSLAALLGALAEDAAEAPPIGPLPVGREQELARVRQALRPHWRL